MIPVLELNDLHVTLRQHRRNIELVKGVSFSVHAGECLGVLGESGSGKSMSIKAAMGLLNKSFLVSGSARFQGEELLGKSAEELRRLRGGKVGIILQNPMTCFDPLYRIGQQISETFLAHNSWSADEIRSRSLDLLEKMRIRNPEEVLEKYPHQLSGGMLQRIMIGIATSMEPALLVADEPTTALDVTIQAQVLAMIGELKEKLETSMLLITHDLGVVAQTCDKVAIMYAGEIIEYGSVEDIFGDRPHHPYTVGLFGSIPDLTVDTDRLKPIAGLMPDPTDLPEGCKFHPRCPHCQEQCKTTRPPVIEKDGHLIQCHLFAKEEEAGV